MNKRNKDQLIKLFNLAHKVYEDVTISIFKDNLWICSFYHLRKIIIQDDNLLDIESCVIDFDNIKYRNYILNKAGRK